MPKVLNTPDFATEEEEANWWDSPAGQEASLQALLDAEKDGTLGRGTLAKRMGLTPTTTIRLDPADIELAKTQAAKLGLRYQTYLKSIIHQALLKAEEAPQPEVAAGQDIAA